MPAIQPERRQLLKAGALVWTVPVISIAAAAPAFASSGANMSTSTGTNAAVPFSRSGSGGNFFINANLTLRNSGSGPTDALSVTITVLSGVTATGQVAPSGWSVGAITATSVRFTLNAPTQIAAGGSLVANFRVRRSGGNGNESITAVVDPGLGANGTIIGSAA